MHLARVIGDSYEVIRKGGLRDVPLMLGATAEEFTATASTIPGEGTPSAEGLPARSSMSPSSLARE